MGTENEPIRRPTFKIPAVNIYYLAVEHVHQLRCQKWSRDYNPVRTFSGGLSNINLLHTHQSITRHL